MWIGAAVPAIWLCIAVVVGGATALVRTDRRAAAGVVLLAVGGLAAAREAASVGERLGDGPITMTGVAVSDPAGVGDAAWVVVEPEARFDGTAWSPAERVARVFVRGRVPGDLAAGEPVLVVGSGRPADFRVRSGAIGGVVDGRRIERLGEAGSVLFRLGNRLRSRVLGGLRAASARPEGALLSGFLIGDVGRLPDADVEALRLAGLSHFVAVSGSNVALFLLAWWMVTAPLAWGPRTRAALGLIGLGVFVVVTRWEPSVVRAAAMAGIVLAGRLAGVPVRPWTALGVAVAGLIAIDGGIVADIGFQLSVAATAGILLGAPLAAGGRQRWVRTTLIATMSAQAAVAPLLLHHFGTVPLLAPATNLVAAPLVGFSTAVGGVGAVAHLAPLVLVGARTAAIVLAIARGAAGLPQLTLPGVLVIAVAGTAAARFRPVRPVAVLSAVVVVLASLVPSGPPGVATAVFLDVGQGDSSLLMGPSGEVILIDGGPDPSVLREHLRSRGIADIDLLIVSHRHSDHVGGLEGLASVARVRRMWHPPQLGEGSPLDTVVAQMLAGGAVVEIPEVGRRVRVGAFTIEVIAPLRRYVSPNDGSLVVRVTAEGTSILFTGDIEAIAQHELGALPADVLKVPHQGSATSDLEWIRASAPRVAVISVGPNDYGHPSQAVIDALLERGAVVHRTDEEGSVVLRLDRVAALPSAP